LDTDPFILHANWVLGSNNKEKVMAVCSRHLIPGSEAPLIVSAVSRDTNLALRRPAFQSTVLDRAEPAGGIDGDLFKEFGFHTLAETYPWWMVDLEQVRETELIVVIDRVNYMPRADTLTVAVSVDLQHWITVFHRPSSGTSKMVTIIPCRRRVRFVRCSLPTANPQPLHLCQVIVLPAKAGIEGPVGQ
jgi:hypothetical protein